MQRRNFLGYLSVLPFTLFGLNKVKDDKPIDTKVSKLKLVIQIAVPNIEDLPYPFFAGLEWIKKHKITPSLITFLEVVHIVIEQGWVNKLFWDTLKSHPICVSIKLFLPDKPNEVVAEWTKPEFTRTIWACLDAK